MREFAHWLATTDLSNIIASTAWIIPAVQSLHILAVGVLIGSVLMLDLRVLGWAGTDQGLPVVVRRYEPWIWAALGILALTGLLMIMGEPVRELLSFSFWAKMTLLVIGAAFVLLLQAVVRRLPEGWENSGGASLAARSLGIFTLFLWAAIVVLGRFIAWDAQIWGALSPQAVV